jgi:hypothetical protein
MSKPKLIKSCRAEKEEEECEGISINLMFMGPCIESITDTMSLLKPIHKTSMLIPYGQLFIQTFHHNGNLITEQGTGEQNPLFQLAIDTMLTSATT